MTRKQVFDIIYDHSDVIRQEYNAQIKSQVKEEMEKATTPEVTTCIHKFISSFYKYVNQSIAPVLKQLRIKYAAKTAAEYEDITEEELKKEVEKEIRPVVESITEKVEQTIKSGCLPEEI